MGDPDSEAADRWKGLIAAEKDAGLRLDQWLAGALGGDFSRSRLQTLMRGGAVLVDGKPITEPKRKVAAGEAVDIELPEPEPALPLGEDIALDILHEDDQLIVIN